MRLNEIQYRLEVYPVLLVCHSEFLVETHNARFEGGMLSFIKSVAAQALMSWLLPTNSAEEPKTLRHHKSNCKKIA